MARRLKAMRVPKYANGFELTLHEDILEEPLSWKKPRVVFVNSMSDMFHEQVPIDFILKAFDVMRQADIHTFQILTKRSKRLIELAPLINWPANVWMGVSVENNNYTFRIDHLRQIKAQLKFLSIEPLLGRISDINLDGIQWVIVGGESGPRARPIKEEWVIEIRDQCLKAGVPFFFKQWGGTHKKQTGRTLQGRTWEQMPLLNPS
jgi:protein gp37